MNKSIIILIDELKTGTALSVASKIGADRCRGISGVLDPALMGTGEYVTNVSSPLNVFRA